MIAMRLTRMKAAGVAKPPFGRSMIVGDFKIHYVRIFEDGTEHRVGPDDADSTSHLGHLRSLDDSGE
jgi:hypothetical protein